MGRIIRYWLRIETRNLEVLDQRLEYDIHIRSYKGHHYFWHPNFGLSYWLFYLDSHAFLLALVLELLAWLLVERSPGVERLLSAFPNVFYEKCWSTSGSAWQPMKIPKCFFLLDSSSTKWDSRGLAFGCLPISCRPCCWWLLWPDTPCNLMPQTLNLFLALVEFYLLAFSLGCLAPAVTRRIHCVSSTW